MRRSRFFLRVHVPSVVCVMQPDPAPKCPECNDFLRLKQLVAINFSRVPGEEEGDAVKHTSIAGTTAAAHETPYFCASCMKTLQFQKACLLKRCACTAISVCGAPHL